MDGAIDQAWAIEVDPAQLCARIEAYVRSKAAISTLEICAKYPDVYSVARFSTEVLCLIANHVKQAIYIDIISKWIQGYACLTGDCLIHQHRDPVQCVYPGLNHGRAPDPDFHKMHRQHMANTLQLIEKNSATGERSRWIRVRV